MKKKTSFTFFVGLHLLFICLLIDKQTRLSRLSYQKQAFQQTLKKMQSKKCTLTTHLHELQNHQKIKAYAKNELQMAPLFLKKIKKLSSESNTNEQTQ